MRQRSQSAVPSVAQTRTLGSRVASRTAATRASGHSDTNHDAGRATNASAATARPASAASEMIRLSLGAAMSAFVRRPSRATGKDRGGGEREPDHAADRLHRADEGHHEDGELVEGQACPAAPEGEDARGDEREQPEERGRPARARPLPLAQDRRERRVDEHQLVVRDDVPPVRRREHAEGGEDDERQRDPLEASCAHQLDAARAARRGRRRGRPSRGGSPRRREAAGRAASGDGLRGATRRRAARATPAKSGSAAVCARSVQPHGPARIARKPTTKVERDDAPPVRAVAKAKPSASRTKAIPRRITARMPASPWAA